MLKLLLLVPPSLSGAAIVTAALVVASLVSAMVIAVVASILSKYKFTEAPSSDEGNVIVGFSSSAATLTCTLEAPLDKASVAADVEVVSATMSVLTLSNTKVAL